jgi:hypothetical protein
MKKEKTKPCIFLWGFDTTTGNPYVDALMFVGGREDKEALKALGMLDLRSRFASGCNVALFHVPTDFTREDIETYVNSAAIPQMRDEIIQKLNAAKVRLSDLTRKRAASSAVEGILLLEEGEEEYG